LVVADAEGSVMTGPLPGVAGAKLALGAFAVGFVWGSPLAGTRSAFTGLGRIAALPDMGVPALREGPPHAASAEPRPTATHATNTAPLSIEAIRVRDELCIGDRVAEPQAFV
jgi:hypothetical protein